MDLSLDALIRDTDIRSARRRLMDRWRREGFYRDMTIAELAAEAARLHSPTELRFFRGGRAHNVSLDELWLQSRVVAAGFRALGVEPGDRILVQLPNVPETAAAYLGASAAGAILVPVPQGHGHGDLAPILDVTRPRVVVATGDHGRPDHLSQVYGLVAERGVSRLVTVGAATAPEGEPWVALLAHPPASPVLSDPDGAFAILFTSGTTGRAKGVIHSHNSWIAELMTMPSPPVGLPSGSVTVQPMPSGHVGGLANLLGPLVHGHHTIFFDTWDTDVVVAQTLAQRAVAISGVPTMHIRILDAAEALAQPLPLRFGVTGGAGIPRSLVERAHAQGWRIQRCYGSSEHPSATMSDPTDDLVTRLATDGAPSRGTEIAILLDSDRSAPLGTDGEVALIGPEQFVGYVDPEMNSAVFTADGWYRSGDIGRLDADGRLTITDRRSDIIIRGGENISSVEVEEALAAHPLIAEAAAVAAPDPHYGERVCVFLRLERGAHIDLAEVHRHVAALGLARHKTPEVIRIVEEFERTPSGKVQKAALRAALREGEQP